MVTVPEANRTLWEALDSVYEAQRDAAQQARQALAKLAGIHPEIAQDPLARDALRAAVARQDGIVRYAESQLALAETMKAYWDQRAAIADGEPEPVPLVRRAGSYLPGHAATRPAAPVTVAE
ncbi:hypothetical protein GCM10017083_40790 [Thalassobaculum fulvum]|jgi:hypothetical protein|uniref:Uncharacterized protein n=1 Tax=Thalassobaculum fulvum TaxID=1633335 RepID=A0A918XV84_9PROT|nr:hypothetical protein [Thalassobaculum fulvum]GHD58194.1 hypothetical protein GCM10017083_40790 [Thalassobaculum fulvum]